jgi:hypothetical protein
MGSTSELPVLEGMQETMREHRPKIICEVKPWELPSIGRTMQDFSDLVESVGYNATTLSGKPIVLRDFREYGDILLSPRS